MHDAKRYVGQALQRGEDHRLVTGRGRYVDDIRVPGVLHLAILRSPHAHAVARNVNLDGARTAPGLSVPLAGADLVGKAGSI